MSYEKVPVGNGRRSPSREITTTRILGVISEEGKMERAEDDGQDLGNFEASDVCFDRVFDDLMHHKNANGNLIISTTDPSLDSIIDNLSAAGVENLLKQRFYNQLDLLKDFSKEHGDCMVPIDHPTLGEWVKMQHRHYKLFEKGLPSPLTKKRFAELGGILGFVNFEGSIQERKDELIEHRRATTTGVLSSAEILALKKKIHLKTAANRVRITKKTSKASSSYKKLPDKDVAVTDSAESLALDEKIRLKKEKAAKKVLLAGKNTKAASSSKNLPDKEAIAAQLEKKRPGRTRKHLSDFQRSLTLNEIFDADELGLNSDAREEVAAPPLCSSMPDISRTDTSSITSAFDDRLRRKLAGENIEDIYKNQQSKEDSKPKRRDSVTVDDLHVDDDSLGDLDTFDATPNSGWKSNQDVSGRASKDHIGLTSWSNLDNTLPSVKKFSIWKLLFEMKGYGDKKCQAECVSAVLNAIIYSDKWNIIPHANGDIALEINTESLSDHKTVELCVREIDHLYTRADFFFY